MQLRVCSLSCLQAVTSFNRYKSCYLIEVEQPSLKPGLACARRLAIFHDYEWRRDRKMILGAGVPVGRGYWDCSETD